MAAPVLGGEVPRTWPHGQLRWPIAPPAAPPARPSGSGSTYRAAHSRDWREQRRLRLAGCPWPGCGFYTVAFVVRPDGSVGEVLGGWAGNILDMPGIAQWEGVVPWSALTSVALTTPGANTWTKDATWNNTSNDVYALGGGGGGSGWTVGGGGGGGAAYSHSANVTLSGSSINYTVGAAGAGNPTATPGANGGDSWFNGTTLAGSSVGAHGGAGDIAGAGGVGGSTTGGVGTDKFAGGTGGTCPSGGGGGGGGAASPHGAGGNGGNGTGAGDPGGGGGGSGGGSAGANGTGSGGTGGNNAPALGGNGGGAGGAGAGVNATAGTNGGGGGGGGSNPVSNAAAGGAGAEFDATHGAGGGGGGGGQAGQQGSGGNYGAGGGGTDSTHTNGGAQGLIFLTWTPAGGPAGQSDWPNPQPPRVTLASTNVGVVGILLTLAGGGAKPFAQADWPNPVRLPDRIANRAHLDSFKLELRGQDNFFGGPGNGPDYDYPNPVLRRLTRQDFFSSPFAPAGVKPFAPPDWPAPRPRLTFLYDIGDTGALPTPTVVVRPFSQTDWPNPRAPARSIDPLVVIETTLAGQDVFFGGPGQPPANLDQPNPVRAIVQRQDFSATPFALIRPPAAAPPFSQTDWPNPQRPLLRYLEPGVDGLTTLPVFGGLPFAQRDWPNPRAAARPADVGFYPPTFLTFVAAAPPFAPIDFPNPILPRSYLRDFGAGMPRTLVAADALPFRQADWPVYRREGRQAPDAGYQATIYAVVRVPFVQTEWPNPLRPAPRDGYAARFNLSFGFDALPFRQADWPVPKGPKAGIDLLTWSPFRPEAGFGFVLAIAKASDGAICMVTVFDEPGGG